MSTRNQSQGVFHPGCIFSAAGPLELEGSSFPENHRFVATGCGPDSVNTLVYQNGNLVCLSVPHESAFLFHNAATRYDQGNATFMGLASLFKRVTTWSETTMGPPRQFGPLSALRRVKRMVDVLLENPSDIGSHAVVSFWLLDALFRSGYSSADLLKAAHVVCSQYESSARLTEEPPDYPFVPTATDVLNNGVQDTFRFTLLETVYHPDGETNNSLSGFLTVTGNRMEISLNGYGEHEAADGEGVPIIVELVGNQPRVIAFNDINSSDPIIINMVEAKEDLREDD